MKAKIAENKLALVSSIPNTQVETQDNVITEIPAVLTGYLPSRGVTIGSLIGIENYGPIIHYSGCPNENGLIAQTIVPITPEKIDNQVLLSFVNENPECPVIVGFLLQPDFNNFESGSVKVKIDGERLLLTAEREIVLRCGEGSITLTRAGKVIIKGSYVLSRSSGYNKIKGAAVDIN